MEGSIDLLVMGPMGCGKGEHLFTSVRKAREDWRQEIVGFKPKGDDRNPGKISSRTGPEMPAYEIPDNDPRKIFEVLREHEGRVGRRCDILVFDEIQFFAAREFFWTIKELIDMGYHIFAAGLDLDFRGEPFGSALHLTTLTPEGNIYRPVSRCACGRRALFSQLFIGDKLAPWEGPLKRVGDVGIKDENPEAKEPDKPRYEPRCARCFIVPRVSRHQ